mgnify:CR=1 FL=1
MFKKKITTENKKGYYLHVIKRYIFVIIGLFVASCVYNLFLLPNDLVIGGVSGISIVTRELIQPATLILILNLLLLLASYFLLGKEKTLGSVAGSLLFPIFIGLTANINDVVAIDNSDMLLIAIFSGALFGSSLGLVLKNGFTTGGTDILNQIVSKYFNVSIGTAMLINDGLIVLAGGIMFGWGIVMYAIIVLYIMSIVADKVILGISNNKAFYIVTSKDKMVKQYIIETLDKGVTTLIAKGGYSDASKNVLMCVVPTRDYFRLKEGISLIDNEAFFVIMDAYEVSGGQRKKVA